MELNYCARVAFTVGGCLSLGAWVASTPDEMESGDMLDCCGYIWFERQIRRLLWIWCELCRKRECAVDVRWTLARYSESGQVKLSPVIHMSALRPSPYKSFRDMQGERGAQSSLKPGSGFRSRKSSCRCENANFVVNESWPCTKTDLEPDVLGVRHSTRTYAYPWHRSFS
jgi:hypothetical protein